MASPAGDETEATAYVVQGPGDPFVLQKVRLGALKSDEVRVKLKATGICHTDVLGAEGNIPVTLPAILGHEGAGEVVAVGSGVSHLGPGDSVIMCFDNCTECKACVSGHPCVCEKFLALNLFGTQTGTVDALGDGPSTTSGPVTTKFFGQSSLASMMNVSVHSCIKVDTQTSLAGKPSPVAWSRLAALGCGFMTGAGTVINICSPTPGCRIGVFGAGAVGLAAIAAAVHLTTAETVIAVDIAPQKLEVADKMGATHCINSKDGLDACVAAIKQATRGAGLDYAIDTTGNVNVIQTMLKALALNGVGLQVAGPSSGKNVELHPSFMVNSTVTYRGVVQGDAIPKLFIPSLLDFYRRGRFPIVDLVREYHYKDIETVIKDMKSGSVVKAVLVWD